MNQIVAITMPKWGLEMTEGTLAAWHVAEGAAAGKGAELADIETAKIVNTLEMDGGGTVRKLIAKVGETLPVGALLAVVADPDVPETDIASFIQGFAPISGHVAQASAPEAPKIAVAPHADTTAKNAEAPATPLARRYANEQGVDLALVTGTGRNGRISQEDVEAFVAARGPAPASAPDPAPPATGAFELIPLGAMRKAIADTLLRSKQTIPHFYLTMDVDVGRLMALRAEVNAAPSQRGKLSLNDFVLRAAALALREVPDVNVHYGDEGIKRFSDVGLGLAVAVDAGLIVPVIADAENKSVWAIGLEAKKLVEKARARGLSAADLAGGTFTVSNLGMFGIRHFEAIINPPQGGILAVGAVRREAMEAATGVVFASVMSVTLSCDHRAIDGAVGAQFLNAFKALVERPTSLII